MSTINIKTGFPKVSQAAPLGAMTDTQGTWGTKETKGAMKS